MRREASERQAWSSENGVNKCVRSATHWKRAVSEVRFGIFVRSSPALAAARTSGPCVSSRMNVCLLVQFPVIFLFPEAPSVNNNTLQHFLLFCIYVLQPLQLNSLNFWAFLSFYFYQVKLHRVCVCVCTRYFCVTWLVRRFMYEHKLCCSHHQLHLVP